MLPGRVTRLQPFKNKAHPLGRPKVLDAMWRAAPPPPTFFNCTINSTLPPIALRAAAMHLLLGTLSGGQPRRGTVRSPAGCLLRKTRKMGCDSRGPPRKTWKGAKVIRSIST